MELTQHAKNDSGKYEMTVVVDSKSFNEAVERVYRRENKKISIQGFRKGKAPRAVIERMYGAGFFYEDALNDILPQAFQTAVEQSGIEYIGRPEIDVPVADKEKGAEIKFTVELRPELTVKGYKGLEAEKTVHTVEESDVEHEIGHLKEKASRVVTVDGRPTQNGDVAVIDFEGFVDGVAFDGGKGERFELTLGSGQFIPGFEDKVAGHSTGEEFDINVKFPDDYSAKELAGKDAVFKIKLHEIRSKEYPEVDDEFAKDVSEFDTLEELKNSIRERLTKENEEAAEAAVENKLLDMVTEGLEGDVPEAMIEDRIDEMSRDFDLRLRSQGMDLATYFRFTGSDEQGFRSSLKPQAEKQVRSRLALEAVARDAEIEVNDEELQKEFERLAEQNKLDIEKVKAFVPEKELRADIRVNKAIDLIKESAKITTVEAKKDAEAAE